MALTCGIQALYDNNREVWFASGLRSAGQQLHNRRCLWDDVTALQNRNTISLPLLGEAGGGGGRGEAETAVHMSMLQATWMRRYINGIIKCHFGSLGCTLQNDYSTTWGCHLVNIVTLYVIVKCVS